MRVQLPRCAVSALLLGIATNAFSPVPHGRVATSSSTSSSFSPTTALFSSFDDKPSAKKVFDDLKSRVNLGSLTNNVSAMKDNAMAGEIGSRGEAWTVSALVLVVCIIFGNIPIVGGATSLVFGPGLLLGGLALITLAVNDLGESLSPWPAPGDKGIVMTGIYSKLRHPMYTGIVAALAGASVASDSASRLLLTAILFYVVDLITEKEEELLQKMYPIEWSVYMEQVPGKYFPKDFFQDITAGLNGNTQKDEAS